MTPTPIFRPLDDKHRVKPRGQWTIRRLADEFAYKGTDYESFSHTYEIEEEDVFSAEWPERKRVFTDISSVEVNGSFTAKMLIAVLQAVAALSEETELTQEAAAESTKSVTCPVDTTFRLGKRDVTVTAVKSGSVDYVEGENYTVDAQSGTIEILAHPDGVVLTKGRAKVDVTFTAAQITGRRKWSLATLVDQRFELTFYQNAKWGSIQTETIFHNVQLRPSDDWVHGTDGNEFATIGFQFRCFPDPVTGAIGTVVERVAA